jgi:hypothetical protein
VLAGGGDTRGVGKNQDPSLALGMTTVALLWTTNAAMLGMTTLAMLGTTEAVFGITNVFYPVSENSLSSAR